MLPDLITVFDERREEVALRMAIGNVELVHECFSKHWRMGTAIMKDIVTEKEGEKSEYEKKHGGQKKDGSGLTSQRGPYSPNQRVNYLTTNNPSSTPWESKFHSVLIYKMRNLCTSVDQDTYAWNCKNKIRHKNWEKARREETTWKKGKRE